jgi:hypothetical protein
MNKELGIYFDDLNEQAQVEVLAFLGLEDEADGNFEILPLFLLETGIEEED